MKSRIRVVSAAIERDGAFLISQRQSKAVLPLLWEFPGGRVEPQESDQEALRRELEHRLQIHAEVLEKVATTEREYDSYIVELHLYACDIGNQEPKAANVNAVAWVKTSDLQNYEFTPADQNSMDALLAQ